jgi:hypothetical protein
MTGRSEVRLSLDLVDAMELVDMLDFIVEWCDRHGDELSGSLERFIGVGDSHYGPAELADDALRLGRRIVEAEADR